MKLTNLLKDLVSAAKTPQATAKPAAPAQAKPNPSGSGDKFEGGAKGAGGAGGAPPTPPPTPEPTRDEQYADAVRQLDKHFDLLDTAAGKGKKDGKMSANDLKAALNNPALPAELREACRFLLEDKAAFKQLDRGAGKGWNDGIISKKDVAVQLSKLPATTQVSTPSETTYQENWNNAVQQLATHFEVLDTAAKGGKPDGKISEKDLKAARDNPKLPQELRDACRFLLENKAALNQLDVAAGKGKVDGIISRKDVAAALFKPASPAQTPKSVDFSSMQAEFSRLWDASFPNGVSQEQGGTLVLDASGNVQIVNTKSGTSGSISLDWNVASNQAVIGSFHTHPYDSSEGGHTGVAFSGGDIANLINGKDRHISIVQSGTEQFMLMKTGATPSSVDSAQFKKEYTARMAELQANGLSFSESSKQAAKEAAQAHGLAYYEGSNGIFQRVHPPT